MKDKKILKLNKKLKSLVATEQQAKQLQEENAYLKDEVKETKMLLETYEPLQKATDEHNTLLEQENADLKKVNRDLEESLHYLRAVADDDRVVPLFDEQRRCFNSKAVACIMNLDNLNIANEKIPLAIKEVLKLIDKEPDRLPTRRRVDTLVGAKGVVARKQLAEVLPDKSDTTLYTDETRKFGRTYNVYIATDVEKNCYLMGLREMSNKSAKTCLDTFKEILTDISESANTEVGDLIVTHIKNTMSDRAQTEVAFNRLLEDYRSYVLEKICVNWHDLSEIEQQSLSKMNNFFCGLHLLVNFAEVCSATLTKFEKTHGQCEDPVGEEGEDD